MIRVLMDKLIVQFQRECFCCQKHLALLEEVFLCSKTREEEFSCTKTPKHLLRRTSSRRTQEELEEEEISWPISDNQNTVVFWYSILVVKDILKKAPEPYMRVGKDGGGGERVGEGGRGWERVEEGG